MQPAGSSGGAGAAPVYHQDFCCLLIRGSSRSTRLTDTSELHQSRGPGVSQEGSKQEASRSKVAPKVTVIFTGGAWGRCGREEQPCRVVQPDSTRGRLVLLSSDPALRASRLGSEPGQGSCVPAALQATRRSFPRFPSSLVPVQLGKVLVQQPHERWRRRFCPELPFPPWSVWDQQEALV